MPTHVYRFDPSGAKKKDSCKALPPVCASLLVLILFYCVFPELFVTVALPPTAAPTGAPTPNPTPMPPMPNCSVPVVAMFPGFDFSEGCVGCLVAYEDKWKCHGFQSGFNNATCRGFYDGMRQAGYLWSDEYRYCPAPDLLPEHPCEVLIDNQMCSACVRILQGGYEKFLTCHEGYRERSCLYGSDVNSNVPLNSSWWCGNETGNVGPIQDLHSPLWTCNAVRQNFWHVHGYSEEPAFFNTSCGGCAVLQHFSGWSCDSSVPSETKCDALVNDNVYSIEETRWCGTSSPTAAPTPLPLCLVDSSNSAVQLATSELLLTYHETCVGLRSLANCSGATPLVSYCKWRGATPKPTPAPPPPDCFGLNEYQCDLFHSVGDCQMNGCNWNGTTETPTAGPTVSVGSSTCYEPQGYAPWMSSEELLCRMGWWMLEWPTYAEERYQEDNTVVGSSGTCVAKHGLNSPCIRAGKDGFEDVAQANLCGSSAKDDHYGKKIAEVCPECGQCTRPQPTGTPTASPTPPPTPATCTDLKSTSLCHYYAGIPSNNYPDSWGAFCDPATQNSQRVRENCLHSCCAVLQGADCGQC